MSRCHGLGVKIVDLEITKNGDERGSSCALLALLSRQGAGKEDILRELYCIVDAGGRVLNVIVEHDIYGRIVGELVIRSRADARRFMQRVIAYGTRPLTDLTEGVHYHTIEAEQEETLDMAVKALAEEGFLAEES